MGFFRKKKQVPFETTIRLTIPLDDDEDPEDISPEDILSRLNISVPDGVSIDEIEITARIKEE